MNKRSLDSPSSSNQETVSPDIEQTVKMPDDIQLDSEVTGVSMHPHRNLVAGGTISGQVKIYSYSSEDPNEELMKLNLHKRQCVSVQFSHDGSDLFTASTDKSIKVVDVETGDVVKKFLKAHDTGIFCMSYIDHFLLASGDYDGEVKVWDLRSQKPLLVLKECNDYISSFAMSKDKKTLLVTSGEGTLSAFNVKSRKMEMQSGEPFDHEYLSCAFIKDEAKAVIGTDDGALNIFNWGEWGNISDRFPGHKSSIEAMLAVNDEVICTGTCDGKIRAVQLFPNRFLGILGDHQLPVESLSLSGNKHVLASGGHDAKIRFWDLSCLEALKCKKVEKSNKKIKNVVLNSKSNKFYDGIE